MAGNAGSWSHRSTFEASPISARRAREFVSQRLVDHRLPYLVDPVRLVTSELATNALAHAQTAFTVTLAGCDETVLLTVRDSSRALPTRRAAQVMEPSGRGLRLSRSSVSSGGPTRTGPVPRRSGRPSPSGGLGSSSPAPRRSLPGRSAWRDDPLAAAPGHSGCDPLRTVGGKYRLTAVPSYCPTGRHGASGGTKGSGLVRGADHWVDRAPPPAPPAGTANRAVWRSPGRRCRRRPGRSCCWRAREGRSRSGRRRVSSGAPAYRRSAGPARPASASGRRRPRPRCGRPRSPRGRRHRSTPPPARVGTGSVIDT